jgi:hypothetical protein
VAATATAGRFRRHRAAAAAGLLLLLGAAGSASPEEPKPGAAPEVEKEKPALAEIGDVEAAPLVRGLEGARRAKTLEDALPALVAIDGKKHASFEGPLGKLLSHAVADVAVRAAAALGDRAGPKTGSLLWRSGWLAPANKKRPEVQAAVLQAMGRAGIELDAKQYDEVESLWRRQPNARTVSLIAEYFAAVKTDKRPLRLLAEALDEPIAGSVNSPSNPPASYWEARWKMWQATKPHVQAAIRAITGQNFETSAEAKAWFEANPKFGYRW